MQEEDLAKVDFEFTMNTKHDLWDYEVATIGGSGVAAQAVNTSVVQWKIGSHYWIILPPVLAATTLTFAILDNKDKDWQDKHVVAMNRFGNIIVGVKIAGAFFFSQAIVLQIWNAAGGDEFAWYARLAVPCTALLLIFPYALLEEHKALSAHPKTPRRLRSCINNPVSVKIFEVLSQGLGADACMGSIFALFVPFQLLTSTQVIIIASSVAGGNIAVELLPKQGNQYLNAFRSTTDIMRTLIKAGALGSAVIRLIFSIAAGLSEDHKVHTVVAAVSGGILAAVMAPAVGYRIYSICRDTNKQKMRELASLNSDEENVRTTRPHPQGFFSETDKLLPGAVEEIVEEAPANNPKKSSCCVML
ncbi:MAG: hypothetical protein M3R00_00170 [Pseudomonadota bacterium]|nr:hypothetical protein [Pseudomonadota bacterium]